MTLSAAQRGLIDTIVRTAPDKVVRDLDQALLGEAGGLGPMAEIQGMVSGEWAERRARRATFAPLVPLCEGGDAPRRNFPRRTLIEIWKSLKSIAPDQVSLAVAQSAQWSDDDEAPAVFNHLCAAAAAGLKSPEGTAFDGAANLLDESEPGGALQFAGYLDLAPLTRDAIVRLPDWVGRMTSERAAAVRLAYRDATTVSPDAGPRLLEILAGHLPEPWQILRLVSAIEDKPGDDFLDGSELAFVGRRFLDDIDARIEALSDFDQAGGARAGFAAADAVAIATHEITEFEQNLALKRDGPWGARIFRQKAALAKKVEALFKKVDDVVASALPVKPSKAGRSTRGLPNLSKEPDALAVTRAEAMLAFVERSRGAAQAGGYASLRAKVMERLDDRLDHYVDDVLENLRADAPEEPLRAAEFLEIAARMVGLVRDEKAAAIVRRRAAA